MSEPEDYKLKYKLFHINDYNIDTSKFKHMLHDFEPELEEKFAKYVGAKHACIGNSASSIMQLALMGIFQNIPSETLMLHPIYLPSIIPIAVSNIIHNSGLPASWEDNADWVGDSYVLYDAGPALSKVDQKAMPFKIIDSAQKVERNQFASSADDNDLMIFSFYPTKPVGGLDGGIMVSNDEAKINYFRTAMHLGVGMAEITEGNWKRQLVIPGWKLHCNSAQSYVALQNLEKLDEKYERLDKIREKYNDAFGTENTSRHLYTMDVDNRDEFRREMNDLKIETGIHYAPAHLYPFYRMAIPNNMDKTLEKADKTVTIPYNEKLTDDDVDFIIKSIKEKI